MAGLLTGLAAMAALALWLRRTEAAASLRPALAALAGFAMGLAALFLSDLVDFTGWEVWLLPPLPILLLRHVDALVGVRPRRWMPGAALAGALCLPFLALPSAARQALLAGVAPDVAPFRLAVALLPFGLFWLALLAITAWSGVQLWRDLHRHRARLAQIVAAPASPRLDGVALLGGFLGLVFAGHLAGLFWAGAGIDLGAGIAGDIFAATVVFGTALHGLTLRPLLPDWAAEVVAPPAAAESGPPAYARSALDAGARERLLSRLDGAMAARQLWREPMLTLKDLAEAAGAKPFYVTQALNQGRGISFFDYVNGWRVREACALLRGTGRGVLEISEAVGFNAKSTFNAAFRKATGMTPSGWRASGPPGQVDPAPAP